MKKIGLYEIAGIAERNLPPALIRPLLTFSWRLVQKVKLLRNMMLTSPQAPYIQIGPVAACNFRCFFCHTHSHRMAEGEFSDKRNEKYYSAFYNDRNNLVMPVEMFQGLIDDLVKIRVREIDLSGTGEPLLHPRIIEMVRYASERNVHCNITTNGSLLNKALIDDLICAGLKSITISINSLDNGTYKVTHGISNDAILPSVLQMIAYLSELKKANIGFRLNASFAVSKLNYAELPAFAEFSGRYDFNAVYYRPYLVLHQAEELLLSKEEAVETDRVLRQLTGSDQAFYKTWQQSIINKTIDLPCYVGYLFCFVNSNGDVLPCCGCKRVIGNLREKRFAEIWEDIPYREFRRKAVSFYRRRNVPNDCDCHICPEPLLQKERFGLLGRGMKKVIDHLG